jgi:hypothetical protein
MKKGCLPIMAGRDTGKLLTKGRDQWRKKQAENHFYNLEAHK